LVISEEGFRSSRKESLSVTWSRQKELSVVEEEELARLKGC